MNAVIMRFVNIYEVFHVAHEKQLNNGDMASARPITQRTGTNAWESGTKIVAPDA